MYITPPYSADGKIKTSKNVFSVWMSSFWAAVRNGNVAAVREAFSAGVSVNARGAVCVLLSICEHIGCIAIAVICWQSLIAWPSMLFSFFAKIFVIFPKHTKYETNPSHLRTLSFQTPIYEAASRGHLELAKMLIENGADVNINSVCQNWMILRMKVDAKHLQFDIHYLSLWVEILYYGYWDGIQYLLTLSFDRVASYVMRNFAFIFLIALHPSHVLLQTPLYLAVLRRQTEVAKVLIEKGADINMKDVRCNWMILLIEIEAEQYVIFVWHQYVSFLETLECVRMHFFRNNFFREKIV